MLEKTHLYLCIVSRKMCVCVEVVVEGTSDFHGIVEMKSNVMFIFNQLLYAHFSLDAFATVK